MPLTDLSQVKTVRLNNGQITVDVLTLGASLQAIYLKDYQHSMVLGSNQLADYLGPCRYFGAIVGRVANRIANSQAQIGEQLYQLTPSSPSPHQLHGGPNGTDCKNWKIIKQSHDAVTLQVMLQDGEMGFPGKLIINVIYQLLEQGLEMKIQASSDRLTLCNLAGHSYFNLDGHGSILDHKLCVHAEHYLPADKDLIPTGEVSPTAGSQFDFTHLRTIGRDDYTELDTNFCLSLAPRSIQKVATLKAPLTGIELELQTTEPGLQVYDGRHIALPKSNSINQVELAPYAGLALEAQHWPDAVHHSHFPPILLTEGDTYEQTTRYLFS
ncbi:aldose epimerase family protein [Marinomonas posidonica]|uniref:Aldose 1-epimerase n=1 Tax=Marinomonas posidonica (strain CECT 7376 / NCIMB 14433 / IVIA-Po-181) TaxID=491952 RepID=F6CWR5_MARPP|nr:aldose epimerase family protein [Marinomonas posidonica]AEF54415.1 Aldose 1-epimerase [Marinomonas posidonica IVIA-Po-181]